MAGCRGAWPRPADPGRCTPNWNGSPATSTSPSGWPTRPGWRWRRPGSAAQGTGAPAGQRSCAAAGSAAAWSCPAGSARCPRLAAGELLAAAGRAGRGGQRRCRRADGHRLVPGPAARHRAAAAGAGPPSTARSGRSDGAPGTPTTPGWPGRTTPTGSLACAAAGARRPVTRWPGCGCAWTRSTSLSACSGRPPEDLRRRPAIGGPAAARRCGPPTGRAVGLGRGPAGRGALRRAARRRAGSSAAGPARRRSTTWC